MNSGDHKQAKDPAALGMPGLAWEKVGAALLLTGVFFLFLPTTSYQFVYDDPYQIVVNTHIHSWRFLPVYFTQNVWSQMPNNGTNLYRPLFLVWLRLNYTLFGAEAAGWHFTTVLTHVLMTGLVYLLARALLRGPAPALAAAAVFGAHPIHVEAVAWVSGVAEPLCGACVLGSLLCYLRWRNTSRNAQLWQLLSLTLFAAGMLVKETAIVLPLLLVAYEYSVGRENEPTKGISIREFGVSLIPYAALLVAYLILRTFAMHGPPRLGSVPLHTSLLSWPWLLWVYLGLLLWPVHLAPLYDFAYVDRISSPHFIVPVAAIVVSVAMLWGWMRRPKSRLGIFLTLWFLITLEPAFAQFCLANTTENYHDRYLYLPSVALAMIVGAIVSRLASKNFASNLLAYGMVAGMTVVFSLSTLRQTSYWASDYSLFERASALSPGNEVAAGNFSVELIRRREYPKALDISETMIRLHPGSKPALHTAALASFLQHDFPKAEHYYSEAVELEPSEPRLWMALGSTQIKLGQYSEAAASLQRAIMLDPQAPLVHYLLGFTLAQLHEWQAAKEQFQAELQLNCDCSSSVTRQALQHIDDHLIAQPAPSLSHFSADRSPEKKAVLSHTAAQ